MPTDIKTLFTQIVAQGHEYLIPHLKLLAPVELASFVKQWSSIDWDLLKEQQKALKKHPSSHNDLKMPPVFETDPKDEAIGLEAIASGKTACLILAGGQATRLRYPHPKGCFPTSLIRKKSLYQILAEKIIAASDRAQRELPMIIFTSDETHDETYFFFLKHQFFGLKQSQLILIKQDSLPLLDFEEHLFFRKRGVLAFGPDGNGKALTKLLESKVYQHLLDTGIEFIQVLPVDNPLALPYDPLLIGFHARQQAGVSLYAVSRRDDEHAGVLVEKEGKVRVLEYFEIETKESVFEWINPGLYVFSVSCFKKEITLPLHVAQKRVSRFEQPTSEKPNAYKFEYFIFDLFELTKKISILQANREEVFAPLKNYQGTNSIKGVQDALLQKDKRQLEKILKHKVDLQRVEIDPRFYYPTPELKQSWADKRLKNQLYIDA